MKVIAIFGVFLLVVGLALSDTLIHPRGCKWIHGRCYSSCEEGTYSYTPKGGCGYLTREATCDNPTPQEDRRGKICDFSACYCAPPTVRDTVTKNCVKLEDCPKEAGTE